MRTVGQILKEEREKQFYTLEEVEKTTKIRKELLEVLEKGEWSKLPPPTFIQGFIKNYGKFLRLDTEKLLAVFRREYLDHKNPPKILESFANPLKNSKFQITPTKILSFVVITLVAIFFIYLFIEYRFLVGAPSLQVFEPQDNISLNSETLQIVGKVDPEVKVMINNQEVSIDSQGNFVQELQVTKSINKIEIVATSKSGQSSKVERTVFLKQ